jgi:hypothetical protein
VPRVGISDLSDDIAEHAAFGIAGETTLLGGDRPGKSLSGRADTARVGVLVSRASKPLPHCSRTGVSVDSVF